jgi:hypothetical protein
MDSDPGCQKHLDPVDTHPEHWSSDKIQYELANLASCVAVELKNRLLHVGRRQLHPTQLSCHPTQTFSLKSQYKFSMVKQNKQTQK